MDLSDRFYYTAFFRKCQLSIEFKVCVNCNKNVQNGLWQITTDQICCAMTWVYTDFFRANGQEHIIHVPIRKPIENTRRRNFVSEAELLTSSHGRTAANG